MGLASVGLSFSSASWTWQPHEVAQHQFEILGAETRAELKLVLGDPTDNRTAARGNSRHMSRMN